MPHYSTSFLLHPVRTLWVNLPAPNRTSHAPADLTRGGAAAACLQREGPTVLLGQLKAIQ